MIFQIGTRVQYQPLYIRDNQEAQHAWYRGHSGEIIDHTSDDFYRVRWDSPNPEPEFFNLGTVFRPEDLRENT